MLVHDSYQHNLFVYDFLYAVMKCSVYLVKQLIEKGHVKRLPDGLLFFINVFLVWYKEV